jgi:hypothetical protein
MNAHISGDKEGEKGDLKTHSRHCLSLEYYRRRGQVRDEPSISFVRPATTLFLFHHRNHRYHPPHSFESLVITTISTFLSTSKAAAGFELSSGKDHAVTWTKSIDSAELKHHHLLLRGDDKIQGRSHERRNSAGRFVAKDENSLPYLSDRDRSNEKSSYPQRLGG